MTLAVLLTLFGNSFFKTSTIGVLLCLACVVLYRQDVWIFLKVNKKPVLFLLLFLVFGVVFSEIPKKSIKGGYDYLRGTALAIPAFLCAKFYTTRQREFEKITFGVILVFIVLLGVYLMPYFFTSEQVAFYTYLLNSSDELFGNIHNLINGLSIIFLLTLCLIAYSTLALNLKVVLGVCATSFLILLIACSSEGTFLALVFAGLSYLYLRRRAWRIPVLGLAGILILGLASLFIFPDFFQQQVSMSLGGFYTRSQIYKSVLAAFWDSPLVGYGINTFKYLAVGQPENYNFRFLFPHQIVLECLFSTGLLGLGLVSAFYYSVFRNIPNPVRQDGFLPVFGVLSLVYLASKGLTDAKYFGFYFSGLIGMAIGFMSSHRDMTRDVHSEVVKDC